MAVNWVQLQSRPAASRNFITGIIFSKYMFFLASDTNIAVLSCREVKPRGTYGLQDFYEKVL